MHRNPHLGRVAGVRIASSRILHIGRLHERHIELVDVRTILAIERCEFSKGGTLGPDWIMPLEKRPVHPFAKAELKKVIGKPEFRSDAKLSVEPVSAPACLRVRIPLADGNPESRVYAYEVVVSWKKAKLVKAVYAKGVHMGVGHEPDGGVTTLDIPKAELPSGKALTFKVKPLSSLGTFGTPLEAEFAV